MMMMMMMDEDDRWLLWMMMMLEDDDDGWWRWWWWWWWWWWTLMIDDDGWWWMIGSLIMSFLWGLGKLLGLLGIGFLCLLSLILQYIFSNTTYFNLKLRHILYYYLAILICVCHSDLLFIFFIFLKCFLWYLLFIINLIDLFKFSFVCYHPIGFKHNTLLFTCIYNYITTPNNTFSSLSS